MSTQDHEAIDNRQIDQMDNDEDEVVNNNNNENTDSTESLNPPTRRILLFSFLSFVGCILFLAAIFEALAVPKSGKSGIYFSLWKECSQDTNGKTTNCQDPGTSTSGNLCDAAKNTINAARAFLIISIVCALTAASLGISSFLGAECVAKKIKFWTFSSSIFAVVFGIISMAIEVAFIANKICDSWSSTIVNFQDSTTGTKIYDVGAQIPLTVVGIGMMIVAAIFSIVPCCAGHLDVFYEHKDCCDDGSNGGNGNGRRNAM